MPFPEQNERHNRPKEGQGHIRLGVYAQQPDRANMGRW